MAKERGASSQLTTLPTPERGFVLHKRAFRDALCLRYGWRPAHLHIECVCGKRFTVQHALSYSWVVSQLYDKNEIQDITTQMLSEVCSKM